MNLIITLDHFQNLRDKLEKIYIQKEISRINLIELRKESKVNGVPSKIIKGSRTSRIERTKDKTPTEYYRSKEARKIAISNQMKLDPEFHQFVLWMKEVQKKAGLNNTRFAIKIGLRDKYHPARMLLAYYRLDHFPSEQTYRKILDLDRRNRIKIVEVKNVTNIRNKGISKVVRIPKSKKGSIANAPIP